MRERALADTDDGNPTTMTQTLGDVSEAHPGTADLTVSQRHRLLAAHHRKTALDILVSRTAPVDLKDLAMAVATQETDVDEADEETVKRVAFALHHTHLPKLADFGVIDYDTEASRVETCPRCPHI